MTDSTPRRIFVVRTLAGACALLVPPLVVRAAPARVEESDETAHGLGYKHDTTKVDNKRYPNHAAAQTCLNCSFWQGSATDEWAGCAMFGRKQISAKGWCGAWSKKPG